MKRLFFLSVFTVCFFCLFTPKATCSEIKRDSVVDSVQVVPSPLQPGQRLLLTPIAFAEREFPLWKESDRLIIEHRLLNYLYACFIKRGYRVEFLPSDIVDTTNSPIEKDSEQKNELALVESNSTKLFVENGADTFSVNATANTKGEQVSEVLDGDARLLPENIPLYEQAYRERLRALLANQVFDEHGEKLTTLFLDVPEQPKIELFDETSHAFATLGGLMQVTFAQTSPTIVLDEKVKKNNREEVQATVFVQLTLLQESLDEQMMMYQSVATGVGSLQFAHDSKQGMNKNASSEGGIVVEKQQMALEQALFLAVEDMFQKNFQN